MAAGGAAPAPRVGRGLAVSAALHAAAVGAFLVARPSVRPPAPPVYRVDLVAAPPGPARDGERTPGAPAPRPTAPAAVAPAPAPPAPAPAPTPRPNAPPKPAAPTERAPPPAPTRASAAASARPAPAAKPTNKPVPKPAPKPEATPPAKPAPAAASRSASERATPKPAPAAGTAIRTPATAAPKPSATASRPATPAAGAGGPPISRPTATSPTGSAGSDPATVRIPGLQFQYPGYLANIVRQVRLRFDPGARAGLLQADVAFLIRRDGSVADIRVVRPSGSYAFDLEAQGAIEAAGTARAFGPLPGGFRDDVLPVTFSFDPRVLR